MFHTAPFASNLRHCLRTTAVFFGMALLCLLPARAQTYTVLHSFTGPDGEYPYSGVTIANGGALYGTASRGGTYQTGVAYQLKHAGSGWVLQVLHNFGNGSDGAVPYAGLTFGNDGALYGTASLGGSGNGTIFNLKPLPIVCRAVPCPWNETQLLSFQTAQGSLPAYGNVVFDQAGNMYGTTQYGGANNNGTVYEMTRQGQQWTETVLYSFGTGQGDGTWPMHNLVMDHAGNLYGTTYQGGANGGGAVFQTGALRAELDRKHHRQFSSGRTAAGGTHHRCRRKSLRRYHRHQQRVG